ncbi:putative magnesium transporter NIPA7 [Glycine soja]
MGIGHSTWYSVRVSLIIHYEKLPNGIFLIIAFCFLHPAFLSYTASAIVVTLFLVLYCTPRYGQTNILVYTGICSIIGSFTWLTELYTIVHRLLHLSDKIIISQVMSVKAIGIVIKLTIEGASQAFHFQTWVFTMFSVTCIIVQLNYLNMDYYGQSVSSIASELCGFITILSGTTILHSTREPDPPVIADLYTPLSPKVSWYIQGNSEPWKQKEEDVSPLNLIAIILQDHFK